MLPSGRKWCYLKDNATLRAWSPDSRRFCSVSDRSPAKVVIWEYDPVAMGPFPYKVDFTWEREWRVKFPNWKLQLDGLPVGLRNPWSLEQGAVVVSKENEIPEVRCALARVQQSGATWTQFIGKIVSLERAAERLAAGDLRFARLETWPNED